MKTAVLIAIVLCFFGVSRAEASIVTTNASFSGGKLVLTERSTVEITAWLGTADCRVGQVTLEKPEVKLISSSKVNESAKSAKLSSNAPKRKPNTIIYNYASGTPSVTLGPYEAGTEIVLGIQTGSFCKSSHVSTDKTFTKLKHNGSNSWTIAWEDSRDMDIDDVFTEVTIVPFQGIVGSQAFADNPVYKLPYPNSVSHKFTVLPGVGEHAKTRAYDISMTKGDTITSSEMGLVLWVEDRFGPGSCTNSLRNQTNVIVIQTEDGVNLTYVHLNQSSALVKPGDIVQQGQPIAAAGNSGFVCSSTGDGTHLHIEWQHNCYSLDQAIKRRTLKGSSIGEPTLLWSCPSFPPDSPYNFTIGGKVTKITTGKLITSDNTAN